ncbi:MAG: GNAT family N-acetyltransferase [Candidatus Cloacimonetes bacterium]|nr:GNAT family N-acetyltransferase [Candidatus Cloacimonadota bacterium]
MVNFNDFYMEFMGIETDRLRKDIFNIFPSLFREQPICKQHFFPVIITEWEGYRICSCTQEMYHFIQNKSEQEAEEILNERYSELNWIQYRRYALENQQEEMDSIALALSLNLYLRIAKDKCEHHIHPDTYEMLKQELIQVVIDESRIASQAYVSDLIAGAANIAVSTHEQFRSKGYAKEVVKSAVNYALRKDHLPLYLVREDNTASIRVAESVGFKLKSLEYCGYWKS